MLRVRPVGGELLGIEAKLGDDAVDEVVRDVGVALVRQRHEQRVRELEVGALLAGGPRGRRGLHGLVTEDGQVAELDPERSRVDVGLELGQRLLGPHGAERTAVVGPLGQHDGSIDRTHRQRIVGLAPGQIVDEELPDPPLLFGKRRISVRRFLRCRLGRRRRGAAEGVGLGEDRQQHDEDPTEPHQHPLAWAHAGTGRGHGLLAPIGGRLSVPLCPTRQIGTTRGGRPGLSQRGEHAPAPAAAGVRVREFSRSGHPL
nr:hypothetical protein [Tessaracoccus defluvii]